MQLNKMDVDSNNLKKMKERSSNVYIPPPARTSGQEQGSFERTVTARSKMYDESKACNDSNLLFAKDKNQVQSTPKWSKKTKPYQKTSKIKKKCDNKITLGNKYIDNTFLPTTNINDIEEIGSSFHLRAGGTSSPSTDEDSPVLPIVDLNDDQKVNLKLDTFENFSSQILKEVESIVNTSDLNFDNIQTHKIIKENRTDASEKNEEKILHGCEINFKPTICSKKSDHGLDTIPNLSQQCEITITPNDRDLKLEEAEEEKEEEEDWESLYNESGETLIDKQLNLNYKRNEKKKETIPRENGDALVKEDDDSSFREETPPNRCSIIEIYGFTSDLKTSDLMMILSPYTSRGLKFSWVDDTHALGIFPTPQLADEVLSCSLPNIRTRPLSQATIASQEKARHLVLPSSLRPKTCPAMARRLVTGALGLRMLITPEARAAEKEMLRKAKEEKKLAARQRDAVWEGVFE